MCAQFMIRASLKDLSIRFRAELPKGFEFKPHVFPRYRAPVLRRASESKREILPMQFGLIPFFERSEKPKKVFHNARSETVHEKPSFKGLLTTKRCLVPMDSFFEYIWIDEKKNWLARFYETSQTTLLAAGLWSEWKSPSGIKIQSFTILTKEPHPFILETGHDRMPVFLDEDGTEQWLDPKSSSQDSLLELLKRDVTLDFKVEEIKKTPTSAQGSFQI